MRADPERSVGPGDATSDPELNLPVRRNAAKMLAAKAAVRPELKTITAMPNGCNAAPCSHWPLPRQKSRTPKFIGSFSRRTRELRG